MAQSPMLAEDYFVLKVRKTFFVQTNELIANGQPYTGVIPVPYFESPPFGLFKYFPSILHDSGLFVFSVLKHFLRNYQKTERLTNVELIETAFEMAGGERNYDRLHFTELTDCVDMKATEGEFEHSVAFTIDKLVLDQDKLDALTPSQKQIMCLQASPDLIVWHKDIIAQLDAYNKSLGGRRSMYGRRNEFDFIPISEFTKS